MLSDQKKEFSNIDLPEQGTRCTDVLSDALRGYSGIRGVEFDVKKGELEVAYDPRSISDEHAIRLVRKAGEAAWERVSHCALKNGASCGECLNQMGDELIEHYRTLARQPLVPHTQFNDGVMSVALSTIDGRASEEKTAAGSFVPELPAILPRGVPRHIVEIIFTLVTLIAGLGAFLGEYFEILPAMAVSGLYLLAYLTGGYYGFLDGLEVLRERRLDVNFLMIMAALGAAAIGQPAEGTALLFLFSLSNTLQTFAMGRSRKAIEKLLDLRPPVATVKRGSRMEIVPVEKLILGDTVLVRPGERFPIDGVVTDGSSDVDQSTITGESMPVQKEPGDPVYAGTVNGRGALEVRVNKLAQNTTLARIVKMVEDAQANKANTQRMLDNFEQVYALLVVAGAVLLVLLPYFLLQHEFQPTFYRAMTWLVVASPCALVISTPASILSAIANGARRGVLFKGGVHLEQTAIIKAVAFDKTGTLTTGTPGLTALRPYNGTDENELLRRAAAIESRSEHPLAAAIVDEAQRRGLELPKATEFQAITGQGVEANIGNQTIWIGNERLFTERGTRIPPDLRSEMNALEKAGQTVMIVYAEGNWLGLLGVSDTLRDDTAEIVADLKRLGVERVVMLTGDNERVAANIAEKTGVDEYHAGLLPQDKVQILKNLRNQYGPTAMVGDGVNDAPALATADVGIAMGGAGTDVALETADVVLMSDDLSHLPYAIGLAKKARSTVWQNLTFSMGVIVLLVATAFGADLPLTLGVLGHEGSTVVVVLNGLRLLGFNR
jgi:Zn2+/Cd2+-exporting ATPase